MMDVTPATHLLYSLRAKRFDCVSLIGEAVDNAFDASATAIGITLGDDEIVFEDDGIGIAKDKMSALFRLGDHRELTSTQLGRFGVGIKSQAVSAGDVLKVISTSREGRLFAQVDWHELSKRPRWEIDDPRIMPVAIDAVTGTKIAISRLRPKAANVSQSRIAEQLALRFHPAIVEGRRISLNGHAIAALDEPEMDDIVDVQLSLSDGRSASVRAGVLKHPSKLNRVHVGYKHRVIKPASDLGCGDYGGINRMFARVQLSGRRWHLSEFKDDLTDEAERAELEDAVQAAIKPILEKVNSASFDARIDAITQRINELMPEELVPARPHRRVTKTAGEKAKRSPGSVAPDKADVGGPATTKAHTGSLLVTFDGDAEEDGIGAFSQTGRRYRVALSRDDPFIARLLASRDQDIAAHSLLALALAVFENGRQQREPELPFEPFGKRVARLLAAQDHPADSLTGARS